MICIGLIATEEIAANSTLMEVDLDLVLYAFHLFFSRSPSNVLKTLSEKDAELFKQMDNDLILTAFLIQERMKGESSEWYPWIQVHFEVSMVIRFFRNVLSFLLSFR